MMYFLKKGSRGKEENKRVRSERRSKRDLEVEKTKAKMILEWITYE